MEIIVTGGEQSKPGLQEGWKKTLVPASGSFCPGANSHWNNPDHDHGGAKCPLQWSDLWTSPTAATSIQENMVSKMAFSLTPSLCLVEQLISCFGAVSGPDESACTLGHIPNFIFCTLLTERLTEHTQPLPDHLSLWLHSCLALEKMEVKLMKKYLHLIKKERKTTYVVDSFLICPALPTFSY